MKQTLQDPALERIKDINSNLNHLSATITGLLRRVQELEKQAKEQVEVNLNHKECIMTMAEELELLITLDEQAEC